MIKKIFLLTILLIGTIYSKDNQISFSGHLDNSSAIVLSDTPTLTNNTTFRLTGAYQYEKAELRTTILFSKNFAPINPLFSIKENSLIYNMINNTTMNALSTLDSNQQMIVSQLQSVLSSQQTTYIPYSSLYNTDNITLDKAYIKMRFSLLDLYIGKQIIAWGTGYAFNPTDVWNNKNPTDPNAPKNGTTAIRAELPFGNYSSFDMIFKPDINFRHTSQGVRFKSTFKGFDYSLSAIRLYGSNYELYNIPRKFIGGFDLSGEIGPLGVIGEIAVINPVYDKSWSNFDSAYIQAVAGVSYTTDDGTNIISEFYYNDLGKSDYKKYTYNDFINVFTGESSGMGKYYLFFGANKTFLYNWNLGINSLINIGDKSLMLLPSIAYNYNDNITISILPNISIGEKDKSEFGSYYSILNFKVEAYF